MALMIERKIILDSYQRFVRVYESKISQFQDIVPTTIEREISEWRHTLNHAEYIDEIPLSKPFNRIEDNFPRKKHSVETNSTMSSEPIVDEFNTLDQSDAMSEASR